MEKISLFDVLPEEIVNIIIKYLYNDYISLYGISHDTKHNIFKLACSNLTALKKYTATKGINWSIIYNETIGYISNFANIYDIIMYDMDDIYTFSVLELYFSMLDREKDENNIINVCIKVYSDRISNSNYILWKLLEFPNGIKDKFILNCFYNNYLDMIKKILTYYTPSENFLKFIDMNRLHILNFYNDCEFRELFYNNNIDLKTYYLKYLTPIKSYNIIDSDNVLISDINNLYLTYYKDYVVNINLVLIFKSRLYYNDLNIYKLTDKDIKIGMENGYYEGS